MRTASATDPTAGQDLQWYENAPYQRLLSREAHGDAVATASLDERFGGFLRPYLPDRRSIVQVQERLKTELRLYRVEIERRRRAAQPAQQAPRRMDRVEPRTLKPWAEGGKEVAVTPTRKELLGYEGTTAVGVSDIEELAGEVFRAASPEAFGTYDPAHPIRPPENVTIAKAHGHAEQAIGQQIHDRLAAMTAEQRAAANGGTMWIRVDQEVCPTCKTGVGKSDRAGVLLRLSKLNPGILFVITADDTSEAIRLLGGVEQP